MTPEQEDHLLTTVTKVGTKMDALISDDHSTGLVPDTMRVVDKHSDQLAYWRGAIAVVAFLLLLLGGTVVAHILGGK